MSSPGTPVTRATWWIRRRLPRHASATRIAPEIIRSAGHLLPSSRTLRRREQGLRFANERDHSAGKTDAQFVPTHAGFRHLCPSGDLRVQSSLGIDRPLSG